MIRILATIIILFVLAAPMVRAQTAYAPAPSITEPTARLSLTARLTQDGTAVDDGLIWRVFDERPDETGEHPLVATAEGGSAVFDVAQGKYLVHVAFGRAGATNMVIVGENGGAVDLVLQAGGLKLAAETEGSAIPADLLRFSVYTVATGADDARKLIALNVAGDRIVRLNRGTYHVVSSYGLINATVRADLEVRAGEVTHATLQHRGAEVSMRLVSREGGDPIANVSWTVLTADGEKVFSSDSLTPSLVLAEGSYEVNVRNGDTVYRKMFEVAAGRNQFLELRLDLDKV